VSTVEHKTPIINSRLNLPHLDCHVDDDIVNEISDLLQVAISIDVGIPT
jgi:hypothetical protein